MSAAAGTVTDALLSRVLDGTAGPFVLLHRPGSGRGGEVEVMLADPHEVERLADLPIPPRSAQGGARHQVFALIPFRQVRERGFDCVDDGTPLLALTITEQQSVPLTDVLRTVPDRPIRLEGGRFDIDDDAYADLVRTVQAKEIGNGEGSNFVLRRSFCAQIRDYGPADALALFRRLLDQESGAYWTFIAHTADRTLVGASPERHLSLREGTLVMNPISGTLRYQPTGPTVTDMLRFLADRKEADELYMVVDEELKMMARVCDLGGRVHGPYLKEMTSLAHTEYLIEGQTTADVRDLLRETMFAPTVVGSPIENACRVIRRYESTGRGYYSGVAALIGVDDDGGQMLDTSILIRTADIGPTGDVRIGAGATIVRHSDPAAETAETKAKTARLVAILSAAERSPFSGDPAVSRALSERNRNIATFWLDSPEDRRRPEPALAGRSVLVIDAEDNFTAMIDQQLRALGLQVTVVPYHQPFRVEDHELVLMGPGPGDPGDLADPKVAVLRRTTTRLLNERRPFLAVCLSHQVLGSLLGLPLVRRERPNQGIQMPIDLFGRTERVGFYNTFALVSQDDVLIPGIGPEPVRIARDPTTGEVHALRSRHFMSVQFHAESILTQDGFGVLSRLLTSMELPIRV